MNKIPIYQVGLPGWITRLVRSAGTVIQPGKPTWETGILLKSFWNFGWITRSVWWASLAGWSGLLGTWALLLLGRFPKNRSQPLHQPLRISKGWREEVWVRGGRKGKSLWRRVEFLGSLRHLLGTSQATGSGSYGWLRGLIWLVGFIVFF